MFALRKLLAAAVLAGVPAVLLAQEYSFEFKGISLGSKLISVDGSPRFSCRDAEEPPAGRICSLKSGVRETVSGARVTSLLLFYYGSRLYRISVGVEPKEFPKVVEALELKYGKGSLEKSMVQDRKGRAVENETYSWQRPGEILKAEKFSQDPASSSVSFAVEASIEEFTR